MLETTKDHASASTDNFSILLKHAKLLVILCTSSPSNQITPLLAELLKVQPSIFALLNQPAFEEIRQQLIAIAGKNQHSAILAAFSSSPAASIFVSKTRKNEFNEVFSKALTSFTSTTNQQLEAASQKGDAKTVGVLLAVLEPEKQKQIGHMLLLQAVQNRFLPMVETLAPFLRFKDYWACDGDGNNVLHVAAENGDVAILQLLISASGIGLLDHTKGNKKGITPLFFAALNNHPQAVSLLLPISQVNAREKLGCTALFIAAQVGATEIVQQLLGEPYSANATLCMKSNGATPLHIASQEGHIDSVRLLLTKLLPQEVIKPLKTGESTLFLAAKNGHSGVVVLLLPHFTGTNLIPFFNQLSHGICCDCPHPKEYISQQFNMLSNVLSGMEKIPQELYKSCINILHAAILKDQFELITLLREKLPLAKILTATSDMSPELSAIHFAASLGKIQALRLLTASLTNAQINRHGSILKMTPLYVATQMKQVDAVTVLLEKADSAQSIMTKSGKLTCLHEACFIGNLPIVGLFLPRLSAEQTDLPTEGGETALTIAIEHGHKAIAQLLLAQLSPQQIVMNLHKVIGKIYCACSAHCNLKVDREAIPQLILLIECIDSMDKPPENLEAAYLRILELVLWKNLDERLMKLVINKVPPEKLATSMAHGSNMPVLHAACICNRINFLNLFLGIIPATHTNFLVLSLRATPLCIATDAGHLDLVKLLLGKSAFPARDITTQIEEDDSDHQSPLLIAVKKDSEEIVDLFLPYLSADQIHAPGHRNNQPLHYAVENNNFRLVTRLLVDGSKMQHINSLNIEQNSPLMIAIENGFTEIALLLIEKIVKLDPVGLTLRGENGSALDKASLTGNKIILKKLRECFDQFGLSESSTSDDSSDSTTGICKALESKRLVPKRFSFEPHWQRIADGEKAGQLKTKRKTHDKLRIIQLIPACSSQLHDTFVAASTTNPPPRAAFDSKAAFHQPAPATKVLPALDELWKHHYYKVFSTKIKKTMYIHVSDAAVAQAEKENVWGDLLEFLTRESGIRFATHEHEAQGLKKLKYLGAEFSVWWLSIRSDLLGNVRLHSTYGQKATTKAITADGHELTVIHLDHLGSHNLDLVKSASSASL